MKFTRFAVLYLICLSSTAHNTYAAQQEQLERSSRNCEILLTSILSFAAPVAVRMVWGFANKTALGPECIEHCPYDSWLLPSMAFSYVVTVGINVMYSSACRRRVIPTQVNDV